MLGSGVYPPGIDPVLVAVPRVTAGPDHQEAVCGRETCFCKENIDSPHPRCLCSKDFAFLFT